ncbi:MAG: S41 family peptidase [Actinomycetota bacterium]
MLERPIAKLLAVFAGLALIAAAFLVGFGLGRGVRPGASRMRLVREAEERIRTARGENLDEKALVQGAIRGMLGSLEDPYAEYLDAETYREFQDVSSGHFSGVGLWLKDEAGQHRVVTVLAGTPAARAGLASGDVVLAVGGQRVDRLSLEQVVQRIKGRAGTNVLLSVSRGGQTLDFALAREDIHIPAVNAKVLRDGSGLIELVTFSNGVGDRVRGAVQDLAGKGVRGFILDLRGNPGGLLEEAVSVASAFLDGGTVVSYRQEGAEAITYPARPPMETDLPLVVLVDEGSASASEIVAGALQDRRRGIVVGTETYGKGSIQSVLPLSDGSAIKLTTASYHTPSGRSIGQEGVTPDVPVDHKEAQLARAQQVLRELLASAPRRAA